MQKSQRPTALDEKLHTMKRLGDEIFVVSTLLHTFAYPCEMKNVEGEMAESMQSVCDIPDAICSIIRMIWPNVEIAAAKWGDDEVR